MSAGRRLPLSTVLVAALLAIAIGALGAGLLFGWGDDDERADVADLDNAVAPPSLDQPVRDTVGDEAPTTPYQTFDGGEASVADYRGRPLVVNFFASWCVPCVREMPAFERVHQDVGERVAFLGIDVRDSKTEGERRIDESGVTYDVGRDPSGSLLAQFGGAAMPTTVLVDADGTIVRLLSGETSGDELREAIDEAFPE